MELKSEQSPLCPAFGECGGCLYQDISYEEELKTKQHSLVQSLSEKLKIDVSFIKNIVPSPKDYHYRHRLDLGLRRSQQGEIVIGFVNSKTRRLMEIDQCPIARPEVSSFIPELKSKAKVILPRDYRMANLTVKTGDDGRVLWGGIGRHSQRLEEKDYLWTEIEGKRVYYSLDSFFQANHFILPALFEVLQQEIKKGENTVFFDLYGGVGLFSIVLAKLFDKVLLIEENYASIQVAQYNVRYHAYEHFEMIEASVENCLIEQLQKYSHMSCVAMVDPPRKGLAPLARKTLCEAQNLEQLIYLSCNPESLIEDLKEFLKSGWQISKVIPFDFFPRTKHLETLVFLKWGGKR